MAKKEKTKTLESLDELLGEEIELKPDKHVILDECLQQVIGFPGFALGNISQVYGPSNSGKSTIALHTIAQAQKQGILPILFISEGKVDWNRAVAMGVDRDPNKLKVVNKYIIIEDIFAKVIEICHLVKTGKIQQDVMIIIDSIGNALAKKEVEIDKDGNITPKPSMMAASKALSDSLRATSIMITDTRKDEYKHMVGLLMVNRGYTKPPDFPGAPSTYVPYGGEGPKYACLLSISVKGSKQLDMVVKGQKKKFGLITKLTVQKNHGSDTSNIGEFVITGDSILPNTKEAITEYKESKKAIWGEDFKVVYSSEKVED